MNRQSKKDEARRISTSIKKYSVLGVGLELLCIQMLNIGPQGLSAVLGAHSLMSNGVVQILLSPIESYWLNKSGYSQLLGRIEVGGASVTGLGVRGYQEERERQRGKNRRSPSDVMDQEHLAELNAP